LHAATRPVALYQAQKSGYLEAMLKSLKSGEPGEAVLHYSTPDFAILRSGQFVRCAITGQKIALDDLRYWSPDLQEAYASGEIAAKRIVAAV
jgi:hypothetical protein